METIIGLLFILLPVIFKLIGKKLEQSGHTEAAGKVRDISEVFGADEDTFETASEAEDTSFVVEPEKPVIEKPVVEKPVKSEPVMFENVTRQTKVSKPVVKKTILIEEEEKKTEKIDPKKLVIYSEIMKPKYTE